MSVILTKFGPGFVKTAQVGVANGVAGLDAGGKILVSVLPASVTGGMMFKGSYDATASLPTSPNNGDLYYVSVAGNAAGFSTPLVIGDLIVYSSSQSAWEPIYAPRTTDLLTEGTTNQFFTTARAQTAAVQNSLAASTVIAPSATAVNSALALKQASFTRFKERFVLTGTDITNGYKILSHPVLGLSLIVGVQGLGMIEESLDGGTTGDYLVSVDSGTSNTKITFKNDLATGGSAPLAAGDVIYTQYEY